MKRQKAQSKLADYTILKTLGSGAQAKVKAAQSATGETVALKIFKRNLDNAQYDQLLMQQLGQEVDCYEHLKHPYIVSIIEFQPEASYMSKSGDQYTCAFIALEYCQNGELFNLIVQGGRLSEPTCRYYFKQLLQACLLMH